MYVFLTASKDATIYSALPTLNAGRDEILEVISLKRAAGNGVYYQVGRGLMEFDTTMVSASLARSTGSAAVFLHLNYCYAEDFSPFTLHVKPLIQDWREGYGRRLSYSRTSSGVNWDSWDGVSDWSSSGGYYTSSYTTSVEVTLPTDLQINVSSLARAWVSGSLANHGLAILPDESYMVTSESIGAIKFFSKDTNTVYQSGMGFGWDDSFYTASGHTVMSTTSSYHIDALAAYSGYLRRMTRIDFSVRERLFSKTFSSTFEPLDTYVLPEDSRYRIVDATDGRVIIDFSDYTKVSCDSEGSFVYIDFSNFSPERNYRIELLVNGTLYSCRTHLRVVR